MRCTQCNAQCIKKGARNDRQQFYCKFCRKYQRNAYRNKRVTEGDMEMIIILNNEGVGINSIGRILDFAASTIIKYLKTIAARTSMPLPNEDGQEYEVDEMLVQIGGDDSQNRNWLMYAINRKTRRAVNFLVGRRTKENLKKLVDELSKLSPKRIFTDKLTLYPTVVEEAIHSTRLNSTNHIERKNLTLRTHLKRLSRKTMCYSKSSEMLRASLQLYFVYKD